MQQAGDSPEIRLLPISLVLGKPAHHAFHGKGVEDVELAPCYIFQASKALSLVNAVFILLKLLSSVRNHMISQL